MDGDKENRLRQHLPRTAEWMQARPHAGVRQAAAANVEKAREATRLVRRVDARMAAHEAAATELASLVSQLGRMADEMDAAGRLARSSPPLLFLLFCNLTGSVVQNRCRTNYWSWRPW